MAVSAGGLDVTKETVQTEAATEVEAAAAVAAAVAMTVAVMTAVGDMSAVDTTAAEEVDLLVWGKLHSATAPKVLLYTVKYETHHHSSTKTININDIIHPSALCSRSPNSGIDFSQPD